MARIIGGVAVSHTPTIGFGFDAGQQESPDWKPIFDGFKPVQRWFAERKPDAIVYIFNDHVTSFFFDHYSAFALGIGESFAVADEGGGPRVLPAVQGDPELARHIATSLVADEFDMSFFQGKPLDHGFFSPMSVLLDREDGQWPTKVIPLQVGVLQFPIPSAARCYKLGQALRRAIQSYPADIDVAVVASGGLSHQVHGERAGFNNPEWDHRFMDLLTSDPAALARLTHAEYATVGGFEGSEIIMWLVMRGALSAGVQRLHSSYYLPSMTGIATLVLDDTAAALEVPGTAQERHRALMAEQLAGIEALEGTYPYTLDRSVKAFRLSTFLHGLTKKANRELFMQQPAQAFDAAGLTAEERRLVTDRDWIGLIRYGVIFFLLEKLGAVVGVSNPAIYASMRGQSLPDFLKTRNTGVVYSVKGTDD